MRQQFLTLNPAALLRQIEDHQCSQVFVPHLFRVCEIVRLLGVPTATYGNSSTAGMLNSATTALAVKAMFNPRTSAM